MKKKIKERLFEVYIPKEKIRPRITQLGTQISEDFEGKDLIIIGVLNGAFIFLADLSRHITVSAQVSFMRISSYQGLQSTESVEKKMEINEDLSGKHVLVVEDIVDTGISMNYLLKEIKTHNPSSVSIATLLFKPEAFQFNYPLNYVGFEIPNKFVVGYGLDYDGLGRNLPDIYQLV
ncbi:hypoxanthine phosphoribosyltransferase [Algoriphagus hitonicola]|uniref:Hypoxanthine phosphoribosyltransferase n=1 Tax=Algoriphagus hitonicola TaxID=435880 RepID=A0A1I2VGR0_9BACT|nr:hypoxanthine phosphoribosyltransferase [Algoriphagus hitonicola]SFG88263.1 hypoxanthine phosphoribosyltransferase [Algoriphagus hitonicola]